MSKAAAYPVFRLAALLALVAACAPAPAAPGPGPEPAGTYKIGWLTDVAGPARDLYYTNYEGAKLYFQDLNDRGGINGRKVEILLEDVGTDPQKAATAAARLIQAGVLLIGGLTTEGSQPPVYEAARRAGIPVVTGHSARPDMFPPADPLLFTVGNVFEIDADARAEMVARVFPQGGMVACYVHDAPAKAAVCDRFLDGVRDLGFRRGPHVNAPVATADFGPYVRPVVENPVDLFAIITIPAHAQGVAAAAANLGYRGPFLFQMTASTEYVIERIVKQTGRRDVYVVSSKVSIYEDNVPEVRRVIETAKKYGSETPPSSSMIEGWILAMAIEQGLSRCGWPCQPQELAKALSNLRLDTRGLMGGPLEWTATDHVGRRYYTAYRWDFDRNRLVRIVDGWPVVVDPANPKKPIK